MSLAVAVRPPEQEHDHESNAYTTRCRRVARTRVLATTYAWSSGSGGWWDDDFFWLPDNGRWPAVTTDIAIIPTDQVGASFQPIWIVTDTIGQLKVQDTGGMHTVVFQGDETLGFKQVTLTGPTSGTNPLRIHIANGGVIKAG